MAEAARIMAADDHLGGVRLPRTPDNMARGFMIRAEIRRLLSDRLKAGEKVDWKQFTYCLAATLDAIEPGTVRKVMHKGKPLQRSYSQTWPQVTPGNILCAGSHAIAHDLDEVPGEIVQAAEEACRAVLRRNCHRFLKAATLGRVLAVTDEERSRLRLRFVGARPKSAKDRKRAADRVRSETKRRKLGAKPRSETIAEQARKAGISPGAMRVRLHRQRAKEAPSHAGETSENVRAHA